MEPAICDVSRKEVRVDGRGPQRILNINSPSLHLETLVQLSSTWYSPNNHLGQSGLVKHVVSAALGTSTGYILKPTVFVFIFDGGTAIGASDITGHLRVVQRNMRRGAESQCVAGPFGAIFHSFALPDLVTHLVSLLACLT